jgi:hypothetical protein
MLFHTTDPDFFWVPVGQESQDLFCESALRQYHLYYGDDFKVEYPTGSDNLMALDQVAEELSRRLMHCSCAMETASARSSAVSASSRMIHIGATTSCFTSIFTATTGLAWEPATKPAGPVSSPS